jgi:hypothetical protein
MEIRFVDGARRWRWAAVFACSLSFAMPCVASPVTADANGPPADVADIAAATESVAAVDVHDLPVASPITTDAEILASVPDVATWVAPADTRDAPPGHAILRADSLVEMLEPLLDPGLLASARENRYPALPGMASSPAVLAAVPVPPTPVRGESPESTWRETGFNVMRWTSAALAVLAVLGVVLVLVMPGLRRRLFFPDLPQMPPRPA